MVISTIEKLNLIPSGTPLRLYCDQYDIAMMGTSTGRYISIQLQKNGVNYIPPSGATATVEGTKPDGTTFTHNAVATYLTSAGLIYVMLYSDMTNVAGDVKMQVVLHEGNNRTASQMIILTVQRSAYTP